MRIGVCLFIESNLGGAATQADDLVTIARRLGHEACLLRFTTKTRARDLFSIESGGLPDHKLISPKAGFRFVGPRVLLNGNSRQIRNFIGSFDVLIYVGGCPHVTRDFDEGQFQEHYYHQLYTEPKCHKIMFFTDPFWQKLYPYAKDVIGQMDRVYAFAEAYRRIVVDSGLCDNVGICNLGVVAAADLAEGMDKRRSRDRFLWPHQWRSWKNPELFIRTAPLLDHESDAYCDGIEYHKIRRDHWDEYRKAVRKDLIKGETLNPVGKVTKFSIVPRDEILQAFATCRWMLDFTGMSGRTGKPLEKFVGNYQCVNIEAMMLGSVTFKYENTVEPYSQIPKDCVISMPLETRPQELARFINSNLGVVKYDRIAAKAKRWSLATFSPLKVFQECFVRSTKKITPAVKAGVYECLE